MAFVLDDRGTKIEVHHNTKGAINELIATAWLMKQGYDVFRNQSPRGRADLVATKWDESGWLAVDVKSEGFDLDGFTPMNEGQRQAALAYRESDIRYLVVKDTGECFWYDDVQSQAAGEEKSYWVDPGTGQRFLHPRNDMSKSEWSFFSFWMLKHHRDKLTQSQIDFLGRISKCTAGAGFRLTKRDKDWLRKTHRYIFRKITQTCPDTGEPLAANDNMKKKSAA